MDFFSLQVGKPAGELNSGELSHRIRDLSPLLSDFAETAAALSCMDLVISVDTAVAHLAGSLGKPVWLLLPFAPDWRWLLGRPDSPWYPSMRLFRQKTPGDWGTVVQEMSAALQSWRQTTDPVSLGT
jgi:ADP-heptose:LPS heptosyltransferase